MSRTQVWSQIPRRNWQTHSFPAYAAAGIPSQGRPDAAPQRAGDRLDRAVDVLERGLPVRDRDAHAAPAIPRGGAHPARALALDRGDHRVSGLVVLGVDEDLRSEEHTSELQSLRQ